MATLNSNKKCKLNVLEVLTNQFFAWRRLLATPHIGEIFDYIDKLLDSKEPQISVSQA
jgi:hypothetical protein